MTTTLGTPTTPTRREQPTALCVVVAVAVVVGWVLYRHYAYDDLNLRILQQQFVSDGGIWVFRMVGAMLLCLPYALVLLLWGRSLLRGVAAAAVAVATGLFMWAWIQAFDNYVVRDGHPSDAALRIFFWVDLLVVAVLVPLAWGLARRSGRAWVAGLLVGPLVAGLLHEMSHWRWWEVNVLLQPHSWSWTLVAVQYVAPFVLAAMACWALEHLEHNPPDLAEMQSSA